MSTCFQCGHYKRCQEILSADATWDKCDFEPSRFYIVGAPQSQLPTSRRSEMMNPLGEYINELIDQSLSTDQFPSKKLIMSAAGELAVFKARLGMKDSELAALQQRITKLEEAQKQLVLLAHLAVTHISLANTDARADQAHKSIDEFVALLEEKE